MDKKEKPLEPAASERNTEMETDTALFNQGEGDDQITGAGLPDDADEVDDADND